MDPRRWWLLVCAVPAIVACAVAAGDPALRTVGDLGVAATGLFASLLLWSCARRTSRPRAWRLLSIAPLFPAAGAVAAAILGAHEGVELAVLRWIPTVPGYLIAIIAILTLVDRARLRAGPRVAAEVALFLGACLVVVQLLVVGPAGRWTALALNEKLVLASAVLATSATMAAALTLLGVIERARRPMALVLLVGTAFLTTGRGLGTSAMLSGAGGVHDGARFLVCTGLLMLAAAALMDVQPAVARPTGRTGRTAPFPTSASSSRTSHCSSRWSPCGSVAMTGVRPSPGTIGGLVFCVAIAAAHRWLTAREEQRMGARLRRSEAYFRSLVQSAGDAVVILDDDLRIAWSSPALERSLGPAAAELLGRPLLAVVHPDDAAALAAVLPSSGDGDGARRCPTPAC